MKMLPDNDFDDLFRKRVDKFETGFDESAWGDMEHLLRKHDRVVWLKSSSVLFLLLFFVGAGGYFVLKTPVPKEAQLAKQKSVIKKSTDKNNLTFPEKSKEKARQNEPVKKDETVQEVAAAKKSKAGKAGPPFTALAKVKPETEKRSNTAERGKTGDNNSAEVLASNERIQSDSVHVKKQTGREILTSVQASKSQKTAAKKTAAKSARPVIWSLTFSAGPDVSSVQKLGGSFPKLQVGFLVNAKVRKNLTLSTGLRYGVKKYSATPFNYALSARGRQLQITGIDASCNVLELPMRVSYTIAAKKHSVLNVNAGLSSYFMLKEDYGYEYAPQTGRPEFYFSKNNANQHVLSVTEISATYSIRPKNIPVSFGIEPYLKLPLAGVGEGKVKLNSTGLSVNITYSFGRK